MGFQRRQAWFKVVAVVGVRVAGLLGVVAPAGCVSEAELLASAGAALDGCTLCICEYDLGWGPGRRNCNEWAVAQTGCTQTNVREVSQDPIPHNGCAVRYQYEGHGRGHCAAIKKPLACIDSGCPQVTACSSACSEFSDPAAARAYLQECAARIQAQGGWSVSIKANQLWGGPCQSGVTLTCTPNGTSEPVYDPCHTGYCYNHGESAACTRPDGSIGSMTCCLDHFVIDAPGGQCHTPCSAAQNRTCWGRPSTMTCELDGEGHPTRELRCCGTGCVGPGPYGGWGQWCTECLPAPIDAGPDAADAGTEGGADAGAEAGADGGAGDAGRDGATEPSVREVETAVSGDYDWTIH